LVFGRREVSPVWSEFLRAHPKVTGGLVLSDRTVSLFDEDVDVAVRIGRLEDSSLRVRLVGATRRVLVASPTYLSERGRPRSPNELASHDLIQFTGLTPGGEWQFWRRGQPTRVRIEPRSSTNSADVALAHAERGGGLTLVLAYQAAEAIRAGRLAVVLDRFEPTPLPIQLVHRATQYPPSSVRAFSEWVLAQAHWDFTRLSSTPAAGKVSTARDKHN
jgi:DNA-binding transcriptional LysR family regulator